MAMTLDDVQALAPDGRAFTTAKKLAKPEKWRRIGRDGDALWGVAVGSKGDTYATFVREGGPDQLRCTCPSRKRPCKHALGLAILAADGHAFNDEALPAHHRFI